VEISASSNSRNTIAACTIENIKESETNQETNTKVYTKERLLQLRGEIKRQ